MSALMLMVACAEKNERKVSNGGRSLIAAGGQTEAELKKSMEEFDRQEKKRIADELANQTSLEFDKLEHDFGTILPDSENECKFKVTNTGKKPLIIQSVKASCGCTTPHKPDKPIAPGQFDFITVGFHPNPGQKNQITKTVTVSANIPGGMAELKIRSFVKN